jgi:hypothetical protein
MAREPQYANHRYGLNIRFVQEETKSCPPKCGRPPRKQTRKSNPSTRGLVS